MKTPSKYNAKGSLRLTRLEIENFIACLPLQCWNGDRYGNMVAFATPEIAAKCPLAGEDGTAYYVEYGLAIYHKETDHTLIRTDLVERLMETAVTI